MPGKYEKKKKKSPVLPIILVLVLLCGAAVFLLRDRLFPQDPGQPEMNVPTTEQTAQTPETTVPPTTVPPTTEPEPEPVVVSTASFTVTGDLLMHKPVIDSCWDSSKDDYDFDPIFTYVTPYIQQADYAVANLETTLCGSEHGYPYSGNPLFNCPDGIATSSLKAGFDMLLTANNHCYDTRIVGIERTLEVLEDMGIESLGTQLEAEDPDYKVIDVNGIQVGMTAFTLETVRQNKDVPSLNGIACHPDIVGMVNTFPLVNHDGFYEEIGAQIEAMKADGAEAIVVYMHWGEEYYLEPTDSQKKMAQNLCDMGVDVIVGGHPHVVEPVDLLTSTLDENHKTLIIYSTGNAVSNQRIHEMRMKSGHTEDGILFHFTLAKYIDGSVDVISTSCTPTWVHMEGYKERYTILPLEDAKRDSWKEDFGLTEELYNSCVNSYNRTTALVREGLERAQSYFDQVSEEKTALLSDPNWQPETEPAEAPTEAPTEAATEAATEPAAEETVPEATAETPSTEATE